MALRQRLVVVALAFALFLPGAWVWGKEPSAPPDPAVSRADQESVDKPAVENEYYELFKVLADTMSQVEQNYVSELSRRELVEAAIRGVMEKLDPYSSYIGPDEIGRFKTSVENQFGGIGIQVSVENGILKIISPIVGSPAYRAGLQAGDVIVEIEGQPTENITLDEAVNRLKGEAGSSVTITVLHPATRQRQTVELTREVINLETVLGDRRKDDDTWDFMLDHERKIGYIRITAFSRDTAADLKRAVNELLRQGLNGLILDLRFNPGGLLRSAIDVADLFLEDGLIVSTKGRNTEERAVHAKKPGTFEYFPMAILVNRYSASASEIVSACLQDHGRAVVIGERTWGKGSVQNVIELEGGRSALKLTTASYWRPNGHNIHRFPDSKESDEWGVMPDKGYDIRLTDEEMSELVRARRQRDILLVNHYKQPESGDKPASSLSKPVDESKPSIEKPSTDKPTSKRPEADKPAVAPKDEPETKPSKKPKADENKSGKTSAKPESTDSQFIDRQLQKAIEYLSLELAKAH